ncbi:MAG: hypothetical protein ABI321_12370 [Polyangia bacterium]
MRPSLGLALAVLLAALPANAYVRSRTPHGTATSWRSSCAIVQPDSGGTPDLGNDVTFATIHSSMQAWRDAVQGCAYLTLTYVDPAPLEAHYDGLNVIKFRTDKWCHPDDSQSSDVCYSTVAAAITTVFYVDSPGSSNDGTLLDTDVELNDINFTFQVVDPAAPLSMTPRSGTSIADLENTLVHELGHLQGLDHTCKDSATPSWEVDDSGNPPPACSAVGTLPAAELDRIVNATMYNSATPGETKKRTPETDDVAGICAAYPLARAPSSCKAANISGYGKGCSYSDRGELPRSLAVLLVALAIVALRRRNA